MATRVFISPSLGEATFFSFRHPRTGKHAQYAVAEGRLLEVRRFRHEDPHSWFMMGAERIEQDGDFFVCTPMDPLFILLPHLQRARGVVTSERRGFLKSLSDVASDDDSGIIESHILELPRLLNQLRSICDVNENYDEPMVRLNDEKVLSWLSRKTEALRQHLSISAGERERTLNSRNQNMSQFDDVKIETGDASSSTTAADCLEEALAFVSEYLQPALAQRLLEQFRVSQDALGAHRGPAKRSEAESSKSWVDQAAEEAAEFGSSVLKEDNVKPKQELPLAKKQKVAPKKVVSAPSKGQKTMASFFGRPK